MILERKNCIFHYHGLYWSELLNGLPWQSMCMRDFWPESSLVFKKKIQKMLNIFKMTTGLVKWGKTSLNYPYVITKGTCAAGFHLNIECIVYFSKVVFSSSISSNWLWANVSSMANSSYRRLHSLLCVCSHFDVNFAKTGVLDTNTFTVVVGHQRDPFSSLITIKFKY